MPDPVRLVAALGAAALVAALVLAVCRHRAAAAGRLLGVALGLSAGCAVLRLRLHWPPREDLDRLLLVVLPFALLTELLASAPRVPRWLVRALRLLVAAGTARVLLDGTAYISAVVGVDERLWSAGEVWLVLGSVALGLGGLWWALAALSRRAAGALLLWSLAVACGGAGLTVMLTGYMTGGIVGLIFAAVLVGTALAGWAFAGRTRADSTLVPAPPVAGLVGLGSVLLVGLLVSGHFFAELSTVQSWALGAAPLAAWLPELLPGKVSPAVRGWLRVAAVAVVVAAVLVGAGRKFAADSGAAPGPDSGVEDYYFYGN